jgi:hypothetical protein
MNAKLKALAHRAWSGAQVLRHWYRAGSEETLWILETVGIQYGHFRSVEEGSAVRPNGDPVPWYTYPALEYLGQFDFGEWDAFEFGGGNSSRYWARRCRSLTTVESNPAWHEKIVQAATPNQRVTLATDPQRYADAVLEGDHPYRLIVIDGEHRRACAERAVTRLAPDGIIVFDNTDWWPQTCAFLRDHGLLQIDFTGLGTINRYAWTTSVFFAKDAKMRLATGRQPEPGIGGLRQIALPE